jgi:hypothetical protein
MPQLCAGEHCLRKEDNTCPAISSVAIRKLAPILGFTVDASSPPKRFARGLRNGMILAGFCEILLRLH